jgi:hypothetical protein
MWPFTFSTESPTSKEYPPKNTTFATRTPTSSLLQRETTTSHGKTIRLDTATGNKEQPTPERHDDILQAKPKSIFPQQTAKDPSINPMANPVDITKTWRRLNPEADPLGTIVTDFSRAVTTSYGVCMKKVASGANPFLPPNLK